MNRSTSLQDDLVAQVPNLRGFARSLAGDLARADDLVQETILRAWSKLDSFEEGTNLRAWLFTILRNVYFSEFRRKSREVEDVDGNYAATLMSAPGQQAHMDLMDFEREFAKLPVEQREALALVGASGFSYEEASDVCGVAVGTVKSRVNRARAALTETLGLKPGDIGSV